MPSASNVPQKPSQPKGKVKVTTLPLTMPAALNAINQEFCLIERLPGIAIIPTIDDPEIHVYSRAEFIQTICSDRIVDGKNVASEWMKWPDRFKAKRLAYAPGQPQIFNNQFNTWVPSAIQPKQGNLDLWNRYIDHIFIKDDSCQDWFLCWLAYQFQFPGTKMHSASVLWSPESSTGKSLFGYTMAELFGIHNFSEINEGELHGRFNFWAARKQFVMGEEIKGSSAQKQADFLKTLITRKSVTIDTKGVPHYTLPDCINYLFTSNREDAFLMEDTERRYFVHRLGSKKFEADYVEKTFKPWLREGGYSAILHYLKYEVDLTKPLSFTNRPFNPFGPAPHTSARRDMIDANRDPVDLWIDGLIANDSPTFIGTEWQLATAEDLHDLFFQSFPREKVAYKTFAGYIRKRLLPVRGGNLIPVCAEQTAKKVYATPAGWKLFDGASLETIISSYKVGRGAMNL